MVSWLQVFFWQGLSLKIMNRTGITLNILNGQHFSIFILDDLYVFCFSFPCCIFGQHRCLQRWTQRILGSHSGRRRLCRSGSARDAHSNWDHHPCNQDTCVICLLIPDIGILTASHCLSLLSLPFSFFAHMPCLSFVQRTREVLGEKGRRIRELTALVQKRFGFPEFFGSKQKGQKPNHVMAWTIFINVLILLIYTMSLEKGMISGTII